MKQKQPKTTKTSKQHGAKVFDVRRPGKAPAAPTSRPVVVGHKPAAQLAQTTISGIGARPLLNAKQKVAVKPAMVVLEEKKPALPAMVPEMEPLMDIGAMAVESSTATSLPVTKPKAVQPPAPINVTAPATPGVKTIVKPLVTTPAAEPPKPPQDKLATIAAEPDPQPLPVETPAPLPPAADLPADTLHETAVPELDLHDMIVSSHSAANKAGMVLLGIVGVVVLAAVILNLLLDVGIIETNSLPHTNFF
ncbi:MAG TPA: hypothetical protein VJ836_02015 [Candidatus Saccharimonadales bacterium]|nr:hypothetical protein [Candidatus Saccharimonadales bacterium]